ncbi:hypothetical protein AALC17_00660 [Oscillospiraceae bacterium 38-13]
MGDVSGNAGLSGGLPEIPISRDGTEPGLDGELSPALYGKSRCARRPEDGPSFVILNDKDGGKRRRVR